MNLAYKELEILAWPGIIKKKNKNTLKMLTDTTNLCADVSYVLYSITRKALMELFDSMPKRMKPVFKAKRGLSQY